MADQRLRELERLAAGGATEARAELLRERLRLGLASRRRVELLSFLGYRAAGVVAPGPWEFHAAEALVVDPAVLGLDLWSRCLAEFGHRVAVRACVAAGSYALPLTERRAGHWVTCHNDVVRVRCAEGHDLLMPRNLVRSLSRERRHYSCSCGVDLYMPGDLTPRRVLAVVQCWLDDSSAENLIACAPARHRRSGVSWWGGDRHSWWARTLELVWRMPGRGSGRPERTARVFAGQMLDRALAAVVEDLQESLDQADQALGTDMAESAEDSIRLTVRAALLTRYCGTATGGGSR